MLIPMLTLSSFWSLGAKAAMVDTQSLLMESQLAYDRQQLVDLVNTDAIKLKLEKYGVSPEAAAERINSMTHEELVTFNDAISDAPAGGDVLGVILVVFVVFVITDMLCATDLFTFVKCINK